MILIDWLPIEDCIIGAHRLHWPTPQSRVTCQWENSVKLMASQAVQQPEQPFKMIDGSGGPGGGIVVRDGV